MGGLLLLVATPIGNLLDFTYRAVEELRLADVILAEDTRRTRVLMERYSIHSPLESFDAHKERIFADRIVERIRGGARVALVSDAGTPGVSDPGAMLVRAVLAAGLTVSPIPGASAVAAAVAAAGVDGPFRFDGFLARKGGDRTRQLESIRRSPIAVVLFESPQRLPETLRELVAVLGAERPAVCCRELTKLHEEITAGTLESLSRRYGDEVLGEVTLVVLPDASGRVEQEAEASAAVDAAKLAARLREEGLAPSRIAKVLSDICGLPHREAYRLAHSSSVAGTADEERTTKNE
jgi:16S rRNA (cytidine1402-2'-O)-methyltransferase